MIDSLDKSTNDIFGKKKPGRPSTGKAMTPAERKRVQRAKALYDFREALEGKKLMSDISMTALIHELQKCIQFGLVDDVKKINSELLRRTKLNS